MLFRFLFIRHLKNHLEFSFHIKAFHYYSHPTVVQTITHHRLKENSSFNTGAGVILNKLGHFFAVLAHGPGASSFNSP